MFFLNFSNWHYDAKAVIFFNLKTVNVATISGDLVIKDPLKSPPGHLLITGVGVLKIDRNDRGTEPPRVKEYYHWLVAWHYSFTRDILTYQWLQLN